MQSTSENDFECFANTGVKFIMAAKLFLTAQSHSDRFQRGYPSRWFSETLDQLYVPSDRNVLSSFPSLQGSRVYSKRFGQLPL